MPGKRGIQVRLLKRSTGGACVELNSQAHVPLHMTLKLGARIMLSVGSEQVKRTFKKSDSSQNTVTGKITMLLLT